MSYQGRRGRGRGYPGPGRGRGSDGSVSSGSGSRSRGDNWGRARGGFRGGNVTPGIYAPPDHTAEIDARLRDNSQDEVLARFKDIDIGATDFPLRPDYGTEGRAVTLRTNYYSMSIPGPFYEYEVVIAPTTSSKRVKRRIFELAEDTQDWKATLAGFVAHDHSAKLVARKELPQPLTIRVPFYDEDEDPPVRDATASKEYTLAIKFIQELETESLKRFIAGDPQYRSYDIMPVISAFNLILAAYPTRSGGGGVMVGRNKFFMPGTGPSMPLGEGLEAVRGFYSSVRTAHMQLMANVNVCATAFYQPGNLGDVMNKFYGARTAAFVRGLRVKTLHLGHRKTIKKVSHHTAKAYKFNSEEYGRISVEEYFFKKYEIELKYPNLPLVDAGGQKASFLPPELCEILPNQPFRGKLLDEQTASMISYAAKPPLENARTIEMQGLKELGFNQDNPTLDAFGVEIGKEMAVVPGRILSSPGVKYSGGADASDFRVDKASWNLKHVRFAKGATLDNWAVLLTRDGGAREFGGAGDPELRKILNDFSDMCRKSGMDLRSAPAIAEAQLPDKRSDQRGERALAKIRDVLTNDIGKVQIILVILSDGDKQIYSELKRLCDVTLDIVTVCVQAGKIRKGNLQYYVNVALKFNMKLGGVNHTLDEAGLAWLREADTMLIGIDVTHPGPGAVKGSPSIAAVTGSIDTDYAQFPASLRMQESKKEMVTNLEDMMLERLEAFRERSKKYPERVLVYRDGVSEGQFAIVIEEEMPAMIAAFRKIRPDYRPKLTIVVCGKRHHTRFFPTQVTDVDVNGNPLPGTVVDRGITSIYHFNFFLQAHGSIHGTSRPTHYYVVHDEIGFTADKLQTLTNNISYMFGRATKAVSLVSPAYYADLACERGRCYLHELLQGFRKGSTTSAGEEQVWKEATKYWGEGPTGDNIKNIMFYL